MLQNIVPNELYIFLFEDQVALHQQKEIKPQLVLIVELNLVKLKVPT